MVYQQGYHQFTHIEWIARGTDVEYIDTSYHDAQQSQWTTTTIITITIVLPSIHRPVVASTVVEVTNLTLWFPPSGERQHTLSMLPIHISHQYILDCSPTTVVGHSVVLLLSNCLLDRFRQWTVFRIAIILNRIIAIRKTVHWRNRSSKQFESRRTTEWPTTVVGEQSRMYWWDIWIGSIDRVCCLSPEGGNQRVKFVTSTTVDATTGWHTHTHTHTHTLTPSLTNPRRYFLVCLPISPSSNTSATTAVLTPPINTLTHPLNVTYTAVTNIVIEPTSWWWRGRWRWSDKQQQSKHDSRWVWEFK